MADPTDVIPFPKAPPNPADQVLSELTSVVTVGLDAKGNVRLVTEKGLAITQVAWLLDCAKAQLIHTYG